MTDISASDQREASAVPDFHHMQNFHAMMDEILRDGQPQANQRTGHTCFVKVGHQLAFDLRHEFPVPTTKKFAMKSMVGELLGFFRGYDNAADFRALGCPIWTQNANETADWLANPYRKGEDDLGRIYGVQWTRWRDGRMAQAAEAQRLIESGYTLKMTDEKQGLFYVEREINQLEKVLRTLLTNPSDRRMIVSAWNVAELDQMALPPCHMDYRFTAMPETKELHVCMTIRSWDVFLGGPFNVSETALFLAIMAKLSGYKPGQVIIQSANTHLYDNHIAQAREQLSRDSFEPPTLELDIAPIRNLDEIKGVFTRIEPDQIRLTPYQSHPAIKADMAP